MCRKLRLVSGSTRRPLLDGNVVHGAVELRQLTGGEIQDVLRQAPDACSRLNQNKHRRLPEQLPHLAELPREQAPENRMHIHARVVVSETARLRTAVVAMLGMVEALGHVLGKGDGPALADARGEQLCQGGAGGRSHQPSRCGLRVNISMT